MKIYEKNLVKKKNKNAQKGNLSLLQTTES